MDSIERFPTWINGRLFEAGEAVVSADDQGLLLGLGVFDGLLFEDGHRFFEVRHLDRFAHGVRSLGIEWPLPWDPGLALDEYCRGLGPRDVFLRLTATRGVPRIGPTLMIGARSIVRPPSGGVSVVVTPGTKAPGGLNSIKSTCRAVHVLAREQAQARGAYDALLASDDGEVVEGTISNLFLVLDDVLVTPSVERGCLPGVMRGLVLEEAEQLGLAVEERRVEVEELGLASEVFLTNTSGGIVGVLDVAGPGAGMRLPGGNGRRTGQLSGCLRAREHADRAAGGEAAGRG
ncbi:MAG: branched-chain amino acid aminotransferase [Chlamydiales bacterium]|jgi:branched-chain amino acid aminotransferase